MSNNKCVLAYSGGLDTSAIVVWLTELGYEVHAVLVDVGQEEDLAVLCDKAIRLGAASACIRDAKPDMFASVIPHAVGLAAVYEGSYRLGTALARPFIAAHQVQLAKALGGATLAHGATGKGNDQIRFEFAYRSLAPEYPVLAPWKSWGFRGRQDLIDYLAAKGFDDGFDANKEYSLDENLWHLSVEGGVLEEAAGSVDVQKVLATVADRFCAGHSGHTPRQTQSPASVELTFTSGVPTAIGGKTTALPELIKTLNSWYRHAAWAWDLVIENRMTGIKSRGLYINPAATLLHLAVDALARTSLNKPMYDQYVCLGRQFGELLYCGAYFSDQRKVIVAAAAAVLKHLNGTVTVQLSPAPHVSRIEATKPIFRREVATFEASEFDHKDAAGFIHLSWLSSIGRPFAEDSHADVMEAGCGASSDLRTLQHLAARGLVSPAV